jgi:hypothetical protein
MSYQKLLQLLNGVLLVIALVGCTAPATHIVLSTPFESSTPASVQTATPNATATSAKISSFEECFALGNLTQGSYPRQCMSQDGEIFTEALDKGVIFSKSYGGANYGIGVFMTTTMDGGYLIIGSGCWILKLDARGEIEWESSLSQELREKFQLTNTSYACWEARQTSDGGYTMWGTGIDDFGTFFRKPFVIKLDRDGHLMSAEIFNEKEGKIPHIDPEGNFIWLNSFGIQGKAIGTLDGGYMIFGKFREGSPDNSIHMFKADENGAYIWERNLCRDKNIQQPWQEAIVCSFSTAQDAIQLQDGGYVITGGFSEGIWLLKTDLDGNVEWIQSYLLAVGSAGYTVVELPAGGYLIAGEQKGDGLLIKTDSAGNLQWDRTFGGNYQDVFRAMEQGSNGEIIIMGWTQLSGPGSNNIWLLGIDVTTLK